MYVKLRSDKYISVRRGCSHKIAEQRKHLRDRDCYSTVINVNSVKYNVMKKKKRLKAAFAHRHVVKLM